MSFIDCILMNPALSPKQAERVIADYKKVYNAHTSGRSSAEAGLVAAKKFAEIQSAIITKQNENIVRDALMWKDIEARLNKIKTGIDSDKADAGRFRFLYGSHTATAAAKVFMERLYTRQQALEARAERSIAGIIEKYRSKNAGITQDTKGFTKVTRELLGESTGDAEAKAMAGEIRKVFDTLHQDYKKAGGILGKLENYFPQSHNPLTVDRAKFDAWWRYLLPRLDRERMVDADTGIRLTDKELEAAARDAYSGITTNGLDEVADRLAQGKRTFGKGGGVARRHSSQRFFHFKDATAFMEYNDKFGYGESGLFEAMMGHIHGMTRDTATMMELGPNAEGQMQRIQAFVAAAGGDSQNSVTLQGMFNVASGRTSWNGKLPAWYRATVATQDLLRAALLGGAPVSALGDAFMLSFTAKVNGLPVMETMGNYFKLLNPADGADRQVARRVSFAAQAASGQSFKQMRNADDVGSRGWPGAVSGAINRASGLAIQTDAVRQALPVETQGLMAGWREIGATWNDVPENMKEAFARWDMGEKDFNNIMASKPYIDPDSKADFIRPEEVALAGHASTARNYELWLMDMAQSASNEPRLFIRALATGFGSKQGTVARAGASSLMMFKSYGFTVVMNHLLPSLRGAASNGRYQRLAGYLLGTLIAGAIVIQAKSVLYGKTPRDMTRGGFWQAAMFQGGGLGIFGDFFNADTNRFQGGLVTTMAGPMAGLVDDASRVMFGNFDKMLSEGEESKFFADMYQITERYTPGVNLWYSRLLIERLLLDDLERAIDPRFDRRMRNMENKMQKETGQEFWIKP